MFATSQSMVLTEKRLFPTCQPMRCSSCNRLCSISLRKALDTKRLSSKRNSSNYELHYITMDRCLSACPNSNSRSMDTVSVHRNTPQSVPVSILKWQWVSTHQCRAHHTSRGAPQNRLLFPGIQEARHGNPSNPVMVSLNDTIRLNYTHID